MNDLIIVEEQIKKELAKSAVRIPPGYSVENAMKAAYLALLEVVDKNKQPALAVCTDTSIKDALLSMAVQGLNPIKKQCYFVVYGKQLTLLRSYMGSVMVAKQVSPAIKDIVGQIIYQDDNIEIEIKGGQEIIVSHKRKFAAISKGDIIGAYAVAVDADSGVIKTEIMTIDDIKASWKQSKMSAVAESGAINQGTTHGKFTGEMAKRTVINRLCKMIINTSNDENLLCAVEAADEERDVIKEEITQSANKITLDFPDNEVIDMPVMATKELAKKITQIETAANRQDKILETLGDFIGHKISGLRELTRDEAENYIAAIESELQEAQPPWD